MPDGCSAPWCGIDGKYANPGVCNAPGGHAYRATADVDERLAGEVRAADECADAVADLGAILRALDLGDHARPASPHDVVIAEVLPAIERLRKQLEEAWPERPRLAGTVRVLRDSSRQRIEVDGRPFPWDVAIPVNVPVSRKDRPSVLVQLIAERVEVVDDVRAPGSIEAELVDCPQCKART